MKKLNYRNEVKHDERKKDYVIKIKNSHAYIRNTIDYKINEYTFDLKLAKRFRMIDANNILKVNDKELEISKYEKEINNEEEEESI